MSHDPRDPRDPAVPARAEPKTSPHPNTLPQGATSPDAEQKGAGTSAVEDKGARAPGAAAAASGGSREQSPSVSSPPGIGGPGRPEATKKPARVPAKAARARAASPLGEDEALITDDDGAASAPAARAGAPARPERRGEREGPPPEVRHEPTSTLELALAQALADYQIEFRPPAGGDPILIVPVDHLLAVARTLNEDPRFACDYPRCLSGVDLIESLELVYHLYSVPLRHQIWLKVRVPHAAPIIPSVTGVWKGAEWHEREAAELFGFDFPGHPFLKMPFLLDDGFEGHPLLKSFELEPEISNVHVG